jgi:hypothetical protein
MVAFMVDKFMQLRYFLPEPRVVLFVEHVVSRSCSSPVKPYSARGARASP